MEHRLKHITVYVQKLKAPWAMCYNLPLVCDKPLGAPASVKHIYSHPSHQAIMHWYLTRMHWTCRHPQTIFKLSNHTNDDTKPSFIPYWQCCNQQAEAVLQFSLALATIEWGISFSSLTNKAWSTNYTLGTMKLPIRAAGLVFLTTMNAPANSGALIKLTLVAQVSNKSRRHLTQIFNKMLITRSLTHHLLYVK